MAPNGEAPAMTAAVAPLLATIIGSFGSGEHRRQQRTPSSHELRSCVADHDDNREAEDGGDPRDAARPAAEVEDARCECCGMSEECTPAYIGAVRRRFSGRWVCGLCAEAVAEEAGKNGGDREAALAAHMAVCRRFNGFGRTHHALFQADAVILIVRRLSGSGPRSPKFSDGPGDIGGGAKNALAAASSSGCTALVAGVRNDQVATN
ncbi:hypothetical protein SEVIR_1G028300v4 [Setaria viridis]|uniref:DUF1677 family protein n=3 Tax=Setaria TaxID=4554 RepID=A0A368PG63_SETIT|nr:uncharacterized protein LOC101775971 [Setaria italica]XP_034591680.1 uncharacterized protein LOC117853416 [Setaria viridis]RCV04767.1 hypothetical protein SETIT_1G027600v2 [Setaria italica]TKW37117.1 hypothetical protein SEVIR_1G028300v2 [Setaria viridis]